MKTKQNTHFNIKIFWPYASIALRHYTVHCTDHLKTKLLIDLDYSGIQTIFFYSPHNHMALQLLCRLGQAGYV